jgi:hypothetical protein
MMIINVPRFILVSSTIETPRSSLLGDTPVSLSHGDEILLFTGASDGQPGRPGEPWCLMVKTWKKTVKCRNMLFFLKEFIISFYKCRKIDVA